MCTAKLLGLLDRALPPELEDIGELPEVDRSVAFSIGERKLQRIVQQRQNAAQQAAK